MSENMFEVIGEGFYDGNEDKLFLPDCDPEDAGWPNVEEYDDGYDLLTSLEAAYGLPGAFGYGPTHVYYDSEEN